MTAVADRTCVCGEPLTGQQRKYHSPACAADAARAARLMAVFNLTPNDYDTILAQQGGLCAVCMKPPRPGQRLAVDHDHASSWVRGLLCSHCNLRVVARVKDPQLLRNAADYLENPPARLALGRDVVAPGRPPRKRRPRRKKTSR